MTLERYTFLHAADLHIDSPLRGLGRYEDAPEEEIRGATRRAFEALVARAIEREVAFVVLAGDLFDGDWRDFSTGIWFVGRLAELTAAGIRVYLLSGNHDAQSRMGARLAHPSGVFEFGTRAPQSFLDEETGAYLHGQGFAKASTTDNLAANYPQAVPGALNIGVLHTALTGAEEHASYAPCTPDELRAKGYDYWALGHVHRREVVSTDPWIVFPGNLQARHVRETGAKGATFVEVEDGAIASVEHESLDVVRFERLEVDLAPFETRFECEEFVEARLAEARDDADGRILAVRVELVGRTRAHAELFRDEAAFIGGLRARANQVGDLWLEKVRLATRPAIDGDGHDIIETLDLEESELIEQAIESWAGELPQLQKVLDKVDLRAEGIELHSDEWRAALAAEARALLVRELLEADADAGERGDG